MKAGLFIVAAAIFFSEAGVAETQQLTVRTVSHDIREFNYSTPANYRTHCDGDNSSVNCNTNGSGGGTSAVYRITEVVTANQNGRLMRYKVSRSARWRWTSLGSLEDGQQFEAKIKGKHMYITSYRGGNQGKKETLKYDILDIRPALAN